MLIRNLVALTIAALITMGLTSLLIRILQQGGILDVPNERSSHSRPTPRGGGLAIVAGALLSIALQSWFWHAPLPNATFVLAIAGIAVTGFLDDAFGLSAAIRLTLHGIMAALLLSSGCALTRLPAPYPLNLPVNEVAGFVISWLWLVGVTNIYNFLDGIDGFAATQGLVACAALSAAPFHSSTLAITVAAAGGCLGFLYHNWHPAKIFMGDVGSTTLGFLIAAAPLQASAQLRPSAVFVTALVVWFFLSDGTYTLIRRAVRGERIWQAHRTHLYQQYVAAGFGHDHVVIRVGLATALLAATAMVSLLTRHPGLMWFTLLLAAVSFVYYRGKVTKLSGTSATTSIQLPFSAKT